MPLTLRNVKIRLASRLGSVSRWQPRRPAPVTTSPAASSRRPHGSTGWPRSTCSSASAPTGNRPANPVLARVLVPGRVGLRSERRRSKVCGLRRSRATGGRGRSPAVSRLDPARAPGSTVADIFPVPTRWRAPSPPACVGLCPRREKAPLRNPPPLLRTRGQRPSAGPVCEIGLLRDALRKGQRPFKAHRQRPALRSTAHPLAPRLRSTTF
jgi:hypothetical protein